MADEDLEQQSRQSQNANEVEEDDEEIASPFDHPAFLPVLLWALTLWFGYDGWFNPDFQAGGESHEHVDFNRYGFVVLIALAIYFTVRELRFARQKEEQAVDPTTRSSGE